MKAIILAGGRGTRLPQSAKNIPKALIKIGSKTILERQIDWLKQYGVTDVRLSLGFRAQEILDYLKNKYEYVVESKPLGTGGAIKFAVKDLKEEFLVLNGDVLSDINLTEFILKGANTIAVKYLEDLRDFGLVKTRGDKILEFSEKPKEKIAGHVNCGLYLLKPEVFKNFPEETFMVETEIFPVLAKENRLKCHTHQGFWLEAGTEERYKTAKKQFKNLIHA